MLLRSCLRRRRFVGRVSGDGTAASRLSTNSGRAPWTVQIGHCRASSRHAAFPSGEAARGRDAPTAVTKIRNVRLSFLRRRRGAARSLRLASRQAGFGPRRAIQFRIRSWADRYPNAHRAPPRRSLVECTHRHSGVPPQRFDSKTGVGRGSSPRSLRSQRPSSKAKGKHRRATSPDKKKRCCGCL